VAVTIGGFSLLGLDEEETRLLVHRESSFAVAIPGHPRAIEPTSERPQYDVIIKLEDVPLELGYRIDRNPLGMQPSTVAATMGAPYANGRAASPPKLSPVTTLLAKGAAAAVSALYTLRGSDDRAMEHLAVTTCAGEDALWTLFQTARFRTGDVTSIEWANFRTALMASQSWITSERPNTQLWPASTFAQPSVKMTFTDEAWHEAQQKAADIGEKLPDEQTEELLKLLLTFANSDDPPWLPIGRATLEIAALRISSTQHERAAKVLLRNLGDVKTTHDFRAWCWQCVWVIGNCGYVAPPEPPN
jgi:hypothetical protein